MMAATETNHHLVVSIVNVTFFLWRCVSIGVLICGAVGGFCVPWSRVATQNFDPSKMDKIWLADRFQKVVTTLNIDLLDLDTISANPCSLIAVASSYTEPLAS